MQSVFDQWADGMLWIDSDYAGSDRTENPMAKIHSDLKQGTQHHPL